VSEKSQIITAERNLKGENLFAKDFIKPFPQDIPVRIVNGWEYDPVGKIHRVVKHRAIDFRLEPGIPILAVANGLAISTSQFRYITSADRKNVIGFARGNCVKILHFGLGLVTYYGHLRNIAPTIPYINPDETDKGFHSEFVDKITHEQLRQYGVFIKSGNNLGDSGLSGLSFEWELPLQSADPNNSIKYWETNPHLHFETVKLGKNGKEEPIDPFGLYSGNPEDYARLLDELNL